jgi:hypothetical protein
MLAVIARLTAAPVTACGKLIVLPNPALMEGILTVNTAVDIQGHFFITLMAIATLTKAIQNCLVYDKMSLGCCCETHC